MIRLEIADYCNNCQEFEPEVYSQALCGVDNDGILNEYHETIIRCERRRLCEDIKNYLEKQTKEKD